MEASEERLSLDAKPRGMEEYSILVVVPIYDKRRVDWMMNSMGLQ